MASTQLYKTDGTPIYPVIEDIPTIDISAGVTISNEVFDKALDAVYNRKRITVINGKSTVFILKCIGGSNKIYMIGLDSDNCLTYYTIIKSTDVITVESENLLNLGIASNTVFGGIKTGFLSRGNKYGINVNSSGLAYVEIPTYFNTMLFINISNNTITSTEYDKLRIAIINNNTNIIIKNINSITTIPFVQFISGEQNNNETLNFIFYDITTNKTRILIINGNTYAISINDML